MMKRTKCPECKKERMILRGGLCHECTVREDEQFYAARAEEAEEASLGRLADELHAAGVDCTQEVL